jgi:hypothetical protein
VVQHPSAAAATNVCLVAGAPSANVSANCPGITNGVTLSAPSGLALNISGDLYIADTGNNCVRQVVGLASGTATQTTAVGKCSNDGSGNAATAIQNPYGVAVSPMQTLVISETSPNNILSYVPGASSVHIIAGLASGLAGSYNSTQDGEAAINVPLNSPRGLTFDSVAHLFIADSLNNIIRELSSGLSFPATPVGSASASQPITFQINQPVNLLSFTGADYSVTSSTCVGAHSPAAPGTTPVTCQIFVRFNPVRPGIRASALRVLDSVSNTSIYLGLQAIGTGSLSLFTPGPLSTIASSLASPANIVTDAEGNAYVLQAGASNILLIPAGNGSPAPYLSLSGVVAPSAIARDAAGNFYVADSTHGTVALFGADGSVNTSYLTDLDTPTALFIDQFNNLFIAQGGASHNLIEAFVSGVRRVIAGSGSNTSPDGVPAVNAAFVSPSSISSNINGILYVADEGGHAVYAIDTEGVIHRVAGTGTTSTTITGVATGTAIVAPVALAIDAAGDIYIADQSTGNIYIVYASSTTGNNIATIVNTSAPPAPNGPLSIALDGSSNLFISRTATNSVLEITYPNPIVNFGSVMVGNTSSVMVQNITNAGTDNINVVSPFSTTDSHFAVNSSSTTCGTVILTGYTCAIAFTFTPTANITYNATSVIASNSFNTPQPIALTGVGHQIVSPAFTVPPITEVYGQNFNASFSVSNVTNIQPTGTITFTNGSQVLCSISGTLPASNSGTCLAGPTGLSVGVYTVTYSYTGDSNYNPASGITTLTVTPAPLSVVVNDASRAVGAANPTFTGTLTGVVSGDTILASYSTTATPASPAGNYPITATLTAVAPASLSNYTVTNTPGTLHVGVATTTFNASAQTEVYGQPYSANFSFTPISGAPTPTGSFSFSSGGKATPLCSFTGTFSAGANICNAGNSGLAVGTYPVSFNYSGDSNYAPYTGTTTLTVTPANLQIAVNNATRAYGAPNPAFTSTITGAVNGDTFTQTFSTTATISSPVGAYPITDAISGPAVSNYTITVTPGILTITQASLPLSVSVNNVSRPYGAANPAFTSTVIGAVNGDTFTITYSTSATLTSPIGTYAITATVTGPNLSNYTLTTTPGTLTITPAALSVTANNASRPYGTANPSFTGTTAGLVNGDIINVTFITTATTNSPVGTYPIVPNVSGAALTNYNLTVNNGTLTITANGNSLVIDVNSAARVYGAANPAFSGTVAGVLPGDNIVVTYSTTATPTSPAGSYPIGASVAGTSAGNYIATIHPGTLAITAAATTTALTSSSPSAVFGTNVTFTATVTPASGTAAGTVNFLDGATLLGTGTLNGSGVATFSTSALTVGTHNISAAFQANNNLNASTASLNEIITAAPTGNFTITAGPNAPFIKGAGTTVYQVTVTPTGGFSGQVALTCAGLPSDATCTFTTPTVTLTAGSSVTTNMTVTTTAADAKVERPTVSPKTPANMAPITFAAVLPNELTGIGFLFAGLRRRKTLGTQKMRLLLLIVFSLGILGLVGCGCPSTVFKTYTINITGTSVTFPTLVQSASVVLSVGQQ